ncbi:MAG: MarR family winged helix-turn-helix transcriptional regulator [Frankiaceae bacterium]
MQSLSDKEFASLLAFRTELRRFNHWSEAQARTAGLTHMQHQLLLTIRGHTDERGPTITEVAEYLFLRHHSAVELVNRAESGGWVARNRDRDDARVVRLRLTPKGEGAIEKLTEMHVQELQRLSPFLDHLVAGL